MEDLEPITGLPPERHGPDEPIRGLLLECRKRFDLFSALPLPLPLNGPNSILSSTPGRASLRVSEYLLLGKRSSLMVWTGEGLAGLGDTFPLITS